MAAPRLAASLYQHCCDTVLLCYAVSCCTVISYVLYELKSCHTILYHTSCRRERAELSLHRALNAPRCFDGSSQFWSAVFYDPKIRD